ncbi:hypothetical protein I5M27_11525 [Adhaeribacter sp. BT258]|uniref:Uncharacterized protein n=1 Tax=Adhaeribacter terrigena TaxID=2793070 RepID=A0ABS1C2J2_9BACT|nr:hypothetical protein [Adhaeribacter terrigena]MBK0403618.1 hypothetical protein [Adhaeribacter terrigena]
MNTANLTNQTYPQALVSVNSVNSVPKHVECKQHIMVPEVAKTRLFRLQQAPEKPPILDQVIQLLRSHGFSERDFRIGITGFGDVKTHLAEIGLVSTTPGFYNLHVGGNRKGDQLNKIYSINVPENTILDELSELLSFFKIARQTGERFGEFVSRKQLV